ncbi:hypothetical protein [Psychromonas sp. KJ10-2]|uniref:hypothetical protein n=1 Tax=Psychromonas sp. KJ10-2 TaxID=3391822 RepID=UPI0039B4CAF3
MEIIFVDAENVGFRGLDAVNPRIIDKVFVFSKVDSIKSYCEQKLFICLDEYPDGANQADFYIIAYLSRLLASITQPEKAILQFNLYTNDKDLIAAFKLQCTLLGVDSKITRFPQKELTTLSVVKPPESRKIENRIFNMLKEPKGLHDIENELNISKAEFTKAVNGLVQAKKIKRTSNNGKSWMQTN